MRICMHVCYRMHMHVYVCLSLANNVRPHYHDPIDQWVVCISACAVMYAHATMSREVNIEDAHGHPTWLQQSLFCNLYICSCRCMLSWKALQNSSSGSALLGTCSDWQCYVCIGSVMYYTHRALCIIVSDLQFVVTDEWRNGVQNCYLYRLLVLLDELLRSVTALVRSQWLGISSTRVVTI